MTNFMIQNVGIHNIIDILHFIELNFINSSFTLQSINVRSKNDLIYSEARDNTMYTVRYVDRSMQDKCRG